MSKNVKNYAKQAEANVEIHTHSDMHPDTNTQADLQQSKVSEPVRGVWLDTAHNQAGQKHCLSPLIKWFKIPCSCACFHHHPKWTHWGGAMTLPGLSDMNRLKRGRKAKFMAGNQGLDLSYTRHAY